MENTVPEPRKWSVFAAAVPGVWRSKVPEPREQSSVTYRSPLRFVVLLPTATWTFASALARVESDIVPFPLMTTVEVPPTKRPEALPIMRLPPTVSVEEPADQLPPDSNIVPDVLTAADCVIVPV